jgi:hypothetical protein
MERYQVHKKREQKKRAESINANNSHFIGDQEIILSNNLRD